MEDDTDGDGCEAVAGVVPVEEARRGVKHLWKIHTAISESIMFFDAKAGVILAANGVLIGSGVGVLEGDRTFAFERPVFLIFAALALLSLAASALCCLLCISPSIVAYDPQSRKMNSPIFFGHIARLDSPEDYEKTVLENLTDSRRALWYMSEQVWALAKVASRKAKLIPSAVLFLGTGLLLALLALFATAV